MSIQKDLQELQEANLIGADTAQRIEDYYALKKVDQPNRLFIVFGVLGALLVGLGIILILAHNWDNLSNVMKTVLAFIPLIIGQLTCAYTLWRKPGSATWRESTSVFLVFSIGACIAMVSQIYNIPGSMGTFMLAWLVLGMPLIYIMRSSATSILALVGMTYYATDLGYFSHPGRVPIYYFLLMGTIVPHYYRLWKHNPNSNFSNFHHWLVPISITIVLGTLTDDHEIWMFPAYMSLFGVFALFGRSDWVHIHRLRNNGYLSLGVLGMLILALTATFDWFWDDWRNATSGLHIEMVVCLLVTLSGIGLLFKKVSHKGWYDLHPPDVLFLCFLILCLLGIASPELAQVAMNMLVLVSGIYYLRLGSQQQHIGLLNLGLIVIVALVLCRFFDTDMSFVVRGLIFITLGVGFFVANYRMLKQKSHE